MEKVIVTTAVPIHPRNVRRGTARAEGIAEGPFVLEFLAPNGAAYRIEGSATGEADDGAPVPFSERVAALRAAFQARPETVPAVLAALALHGVAIPTETLEAAGAVDWTEPADPLPHEPAEMVELPDGTHAPVTYPGTVRAPDGTLRDAETGEEVVKSRPLAPGEL